MSQFYLCSDRGFVANIRSGKGFITNHNSPISQYDHLRRNVSHTLITGFIFKMGAKLGTNCDAPPPFQDTSVTTLCFTLYGEALGRKDTEETI